MYCNELGMMFSYLVYINNHVKTQKRREKTVIPGIKVQLEVLIISRETAGC